MRYYIQFSVLFIFCLAACTSDKQAPKSGEKLSKEDFTTTEVVEVEDTFEPDGTADNEINPKGLHFDYDMTKWTDVGLVEPGIMIDLKYATTDNFVETKMYDCGRCFLRPEVATQIIAIHHELQGQALGLKMLDCYRPRPIQWKLWDKVPDPRYVADPRKGSMHNRGSAVDLTIIDSKGNELDMGTPFDFFGKEAYHDYTKHSEKINKNRAILKGIMEKFDFKSIRTEWWHYSYRKKRYELDDMLWKCE